MPETTTSRTSGRVPLIPRDDLFGNPERSEVQLSPDGRHLSWLAAVDGVLNVWVAPADDLDAARPVTRDTTRGIHTYLWSHRPDTVLYLRDSGGDEDYHLHAVDVTSLDDRDLTPVPGTTAQLVAASHARPDEVLVGLNDRDPQWHDVHRVDLATGERSLVEQNTDGIGGYHADADHVLRFAERPRPDGGTHLLRRDADGDGEGWEVFQDVPFEDSMTTAVSHLSADGQRLYLIDSTGRDTAALYAVHLPSGERTLLHEDGRADIGDLMVHPRTDEVDAVATAYLRKEWHVLDAQVEGDLRMLGELGGEVQVVSRTLDDRTWVVARSAAEAPATYHRLDRESGTLTRLFAARPVLEGAPLAPMEAHEIPSRDGLTLVSYLTLPADFAEGRPVPMVLLVHGGPWGRDAYGYNAWHQWLANRGYAVLAVNFRGSAGFGKAFLGAGDGQWAAAMHDDLLDAVDWAVERGVTTADRVAIMGGSYGGYATLVGLTFTPERFACGVDIVGPANLNTLLETVPPYWAAFFEQLARRMGDPRTEEGRAWLTERSPLTRADRIRRPLLIGQGANDPRVKQAESDQIVQAMQEGGIPVTYALFPDEGHGFARPENTKAFNALTEGFLQQVLGGRAEPIGDDLVGSSLTVPVGADGVTGLPEALEGHEPVVRS